jgi:hypothetical protein
MPNTLPDEPAQLRAALGEALRREAALRESTTREFLELQARLQPLTTVIGERGRIIEELKQRELALRFEVEQATADLEAFSWMLQDMEKARAKAEARTPAGWLRALLATGRKPAGARTPAGDFSYHLTTSPFRLYRAETFTLRGWAVPRDHRAVTAIRARLAGREFAGRHGLPAPEAAATAGAAATHPAPGFEVTFDTPPGRHRLALEAQLEGREWRSILEIPVWCRPGN